MTLPPLPLVNGALFVSNSFLEWVQRCNRGAQYYKLNNRVSADETAALTFGTHLHSAFEMHYRLQEFDLSQSEISARVASMLQEEFQNEPIEENDFRTLNWAIEIYERFAKKYEWEEFDLMRFEKPVKCKYCQGMKLKHELVNGMVVLNQLSEPCPWCNGTGFSSIMCEVPFVVKLFDYKPTTYALAQELHFKEGDPFVLPVYYHGYIDLITSINSFIYPLDFKSTAVLGNGFWDDKKMSAQPKGYCYGFKETTGLNVKGYITRAIRTTPMPDNVRTGTPATRGANKGLVTSQEKWWSETLPDDQKEILGEGELDDWKDNTITLIEEFLWHYSRGKMPRSTTACTGKFGRCQYFEVCNTFPVSDRELILDSGLYKDKENKTPNLVPNEQTKTT